MTTMTVQQADRILAALKGHGWSTLGDLRERLQWTATETPELRVCVRALRRRGLVLTTAEWVPPFRVCLTAEAEA